MRTTSRVLQRLWARFCANWITSLGVLLIFLGVGYYTFTAVSDTHRQPYDCADVIMTNLSGPQASDQAQLTWNCLGPQYQSQFHGPAVLINASSQRQHQFQFHRVGQTQPHQDGTVNVFYDTTDGIQHAWRVVTLDSNGKVVGLD